MKRSGFSLVSLLVLLAITLAACGPAATPTAAPATAAPAAPVKAEPTKAPAAAPTTAPAAAPAAAAAAPKDRLPITVAHAGAIDQATAFVCQDNGVFEKNGLDAKIKGYATGVEVVNALNAGEVEVGLFGSTPLLTSVSNGIPLQLIAYNHGDATKKIYNANQGVIASKASGVGPGEIAKLKGKKVGLPVGTGAEPYFQGLLKQAGLQKSDVEIVNVKPADMPTALAQGSVDAVSIWEAVSSTILKQVPGSVRVTLGESPSWFDPGTVVTTKKTIADKRETLKRFLVAHAECEQYVRQHPDESATIATRYLTGLDLDVAKQAIKAPIFDSRLSKLTVEGYNEIHIPFLVGLGSIKSLDGAQAVDSSLIVQVMKEHPEFFKDLPPIPADKVLN